jgi:hypothetical protein
METGAARSAISISKRGRLTRQTPSFAAARSTSFSTSNVQSEVIEMFSEKDPKVKALLRNINRQADLAEKLQGLVSKQNELEDALLGNLVPDSKAGGPDLREELALSVVDGCEMSMESLLSILERAKEQLKNE